MKMIGNMGFRMLFGGCNTFVSNNEEFVLLCFTHIVNGWTKDCHT